MITKIKKVYYCEYCNKHTLLSFATQKHENHCTSNPKRECRMCGCSPNYIEIVNELKKRYEIYQEPTGLSNYYTTKVKWLGEPITTDEVFDLVDSCPACTLTVMKLTGLFQTDTFTDFNFKEEIDKFWKEKNRDRNFEEENGGYY
jgi:hypothetical protein